MKGLWWLLAGAAVLASCGEEKATSRRPAAAPSAQPQCSTPAPPRAAAAPGSETPGAASPPAALPRTASAVAAVPPPIVAATETAPSARPKATPRPRRVLRFNRLKSIDHRGIGIEAFSLLVPEGWTLDGGVFWPLDNPGMPGNVAYRVAGPGGEQLEVFPTLSCFWTNNQALLEQHALGTRYLGSEVRPPLQPTEVLEQIVLPRCRRDARRLRVVEAKPLPDLARRLGPGGAGQPSGQADLMGGRLRVEYDLAGQPMEELLYAAVETHSSSAPTAYGVVTDVNWIASYLFAFRAPRGTLARRMETFQVILRSFRIHPQWFNKYNQLIQILVREQARTIESIERVRRIVGQTSDELSEATVQAWQQSNDTYARMADQFSPSGRGLDRYRDPVTRQSIQLPGGCTRGWANGHGAYIVTDDPAFEPEAEGKWTPLAPSASDSSLLRISPDAVAGGRRRVQADGLPQLGLFQAEADWQPRRAAADLPNEVRVKLGPKLARKPPPPVG